MTSPGQALGEVLAATGARTAAGRDDAEAIPGRSDSELSDGNRVRVSRVELDVVTLVGHIPGSVALISDDAAGIGHLFTGDSLFPGGVGKTSGSETFATLIDDVKHKLFDRLPDETWSYPGHGRGLDPGRRATVPRGVARGW